MIDKNKQYRTRDGRQVRIYATDGPGNQIHGAILESHGWVLSSWERSGRFLSHLLDHKCDLIEVKPRINREVWANVYREEVRVYSCREYADSAAGRRIACVKLMIDCEEGEGL